MVAARHRGASKKNRNGKPANSSRQIDGAMTIARKPGGKNNAITHGAYAKDLLLPNESPEEFERLHQGLIKEWNPTGTTEDEAVLTIAKWMWSKRRIERFYREEAADLRYQN